MLAKFWIGIKYKSEIVKIVFRNPQTIELTNFSPKKGQRDIFTRGIKQWAKLLESIWVQPTHA